MFVDVKGVPRLSPEEYKQSPIRILLPENLLLIFSKLNGQDLERCGFVNKEWKKLTATVQWIRLVRSSKCTIIGKVHWEKFIGKIGDPPRPPKNIIRILSAKCPISNNEKSTSETHMLVLIPEKVNDQTLTLESLCELVKAPREGHQIQHPFLSSSLLNSIKKTSRPSHWVLMSKDIIGGKDKFKGSRYKTAASHEAMIKEQVQKPYAMPFARDLITCLFMHYVMTGERLLGVEPKTYSRCRDKTKEGLSVNVGAFSSSGIHVDTGNFGYESVGLVVARHF